MVRNFPVLQNVLANIGIALITFCLMATAYGLGVRFSQSNVRFHDAVQRNHAICVAIEGLKRQNREDALLDYKNLNQTLHLLKLKRTPEIVKAAQATRDHKLLVNKAKKC